MSRKQNRNTYTIRASRTIEGKTIDIPADIVNFYYANGDWGFSVQIRKHRHQFFWYAYKRIKGKLHSIYLSNVWSLTDTLLWNAAQAFKNIAVSKMTLEEFRLFDENEFTNGNWIVTDPGMVAEFDFWEKEQGFNNAA